MHTGPAAAALLDAALPVHRHRADRPPASSAEVAREGRKPPAEAPAPEVYVNRYKSAWAPAIQNLNLVIEAASRKVRGGVGLPYRILTSSKGDQGGRVVVACLTLAH